MEKYISQKRILIRYAEDGGADLEGIIQIRKGVSDISLGEKNYAMVRIPIFKHWYIKGMAIYSENIPDGYDIVYNTSKAKGTPLKTNDATKRGQCVYKYSSNAMFEIQRAKNFTIPDLSDKAPHIPPIIPQKKEEKGVYTVKVSYPTSDDYKIQIGPGEIQITGTKPFDVFCIQSQQKQEL